MVSRVPQRVKDTSAGIAYTGAVVSLSLLLKEYLGIAEFDVTDKASMERMDVLNNNAGLYITGFLALATGLVALGKGAIKSGYYAISGIDRTQKQSYVPFKNSR